MMKKRRPSLGDCGVMPLSRTMHSYLLSAYLMWPLIISIGLISPSAAAVFAVFASFLVLGFLFYNMMVAMVQMSHDMKKRLRISQWIFYVSLTILVICMAWGNG